MASSRDKEASTERTETKWAIIKYRLSIGAVIFSILLFCFMMFSDAVFNFECSVWDFVTFKCNRFDANFEGWK